MFVEVFVFCLLSVIGTGAFVGMQMLEERKRFDSSEAESKKLIANLRKEMEEKDENIAQLEKEIKTKKKKPENERLKELGSNVDKTSRMLQKQTSQISHFQNMIEGLLAQISEANVRIEKLRIYEETYTHVKREKQELEAEIGRARSPKFAIESLETHDWSFVKEKKKTELVARLEAVIRMLKQGGNFSKNK